MAQVLGVLRCYIVIDVIGHYIRSSTYGQGVSAPPLLSDSLSRQILLGWLNTIRSYFDLAFGYRICALVAVGIGLWSLPSGHLRSALSLKPIQ